MPTEKAKKHYLGKDGYLKLNCAQSVVAAFQESCTMADANIDLFVAHGGGKAPQGLCGAVYAASILAGDNAGKI